MKEKDFISTCSTTVLGKPRSTKHHGNVPRPQVAEVYLKHTASIDIHNHVRSGSRALKDVWKTKSPVRRQLAGILGFCFTNSYLAMQYFKNPNLEHYSFKMKASNALVSYRNLSASQTRELDVSAEMQLHSVKKIPYPVQCYYCQHEYDKPRSKKSSTTFKCGCCEIALCKPSKGECWNLHVLNGVPKKQRVQPK